jgi:hypothetical protein
MASEWRKVADLSGYEISSEGALRNAKTGRELRGQKTSGGYIRFCVSSGGKPKGIMAHRIVCAEFLGPVPDQMQVNHKDHDPSNNRVDNLEFVYARENNNHRNQIRERSLPKGVFISKQRKVKIFRATYEHLGNRYHLGYFDTPEEAHLAYLASIPDHESKYASSIAKVLEEIPHIVPSYSLRDKRDYVGNGTHKCRRCGRFVKSFIQKCSSCALTPPTQETGHD